MLPSTEAGRAEQLKLPMCRFCLITITPDIQAVSCSLAAKSRNEKVTLHQAPKFASTAFMKFIGIFNAQIKMPFSTLQTTNQECPLFPQNA